MKKTITACVAALLIIALAITLACFLNKPMSADAAGNTLSANYIGDHGQLTDVEGGHRDDAQEVAYLTANKNAASDKILKITTGEQLFNFLKGNAGSYTHAYLANDVKIAYNKEIDNTYTKINQNSSDAVFDKVLDGNGYTVGIYGGTGTSVYYQTNDNYFSYGATNYRNTGYLVAINRGTIENMTVDFRSDHQTLTAIKGGVDSGQGFQGNDNNSNSGLFTANGSAGTCAGVVAGFNDNGGVIDNVRVNLINPLKVVDWRDQNNGDMNKNFAFVGGIVGRAGVGSLLNDSQVHISDNASITCAAQGYDVGLTKQGAALAVAGGLVGKIDQGTTENNVTLNAEVKYCAITGGGFIRSFVEKARMGSTGNDSGGYRAYTGGAVGGCFNISDRLGGLQDGGASSGVKHEVNRGQITGIISAWTGYTQNNYDNNNNVSYGQLFGSAGKNVESMVVLYDVMALRSSEGDRNETLDSPQSTVVSDWVGIYPTTEGGTINVRLNQDTSSRYDFRVHAFASNVNKSDDEIDAELLAEDMGDSDNRRNTLSNGQTGNIIWRAMMSKGDKTSERISLLISAPVVSEINMISSSTSGNYAYTFGTMTTLTLDGRANGNSNSRPYQGKSATLIRPTALTATGLEAELNDNEWIITRNGVQTNSNMSGTALPGTYVMSVKAETKTYTDLGYYNDSQRTAAWIPTSYSFIIAEGELNYGNVVVSDTWSDSAEFQLLMGSADDFDSIRCVRNGSVIKSDDDYATVDTIEYSRSASGEMVTIKVTETTGKNGTTYSFIAYAKDGDKDIIVAKTNSSEDRLVKIDREQPEVSEIAYYTRDSQGKETKISANERFTWSKDRIVAKYNVMDAKSGIKFAPSSIKDDGAQIINRKQTDGSYNVEVIMSKNTNYVITYTDNTGNTKDVELQANVDYMDTDPTLAFSGQWYPYRSNYGYSTEGARVRFNPTIGCSDWKLQYSWQKNSDGSDKWEDAMAEGSKTELYYLNDTGQQSFLIDWNMYDTVRRIGYDFKLRMVNVQGLYGDEIDHAVYLSKNNVESVDGFVNSYAINYKIANIYVDKSLEGLIISGGAFDGKSVAWVIANASKEQLSELFDKQYDATDIYDTDGNGNKITFSVNVDFQAEDREDVNGFAKSTGIGVLYSPAYIAYPEVVETQIKVELRYESANVDDQVNLIATFLPSEEDEGNYNFYFADNSKIDFEDAYTPVSDKFISSPMIIPTATKITPYEATVQLAYARGLQRVYTYGETVPKTLTVNVGILNQPIEIELDCAAQSVKPVTDPEDESMWYPCTGRVLTDVGRNMKITIEGTTIGIEARPVYVDIKLDGKADLPSSVSAGREYKFTATYYDPVEGKDKSANVRLANDAPASEPVLNAPILEVGNYTITVSIADKNFIVKDAYRDKEGNVIDTDDIYVFYFSIRQGQLALAMGVNVVEYDGGNQINYNPGIPAGLNSNLFSEEGLTYTYYPYYANATYNATTRTITGEYNRNEGTSESPSEIGLYHVEVSYAGSSAFFAETYDNGDIVITKAKTEIIFGATVKYNFDVDDNKDALWRCLDVNTAHTLVQSSKSKQELWNWASEDEKPTLRVLYLTDRGEWKEVGSEPGSDGWYSKVGTYSYRVEYDGDDKYEKCSANITMTIDKALFKGIRFLGAEGVFDGSDYVAKLQPIGLGSYPNATVTYRFNGTTYTSLRDIHITNAGSHTVTMFVREEGYIDERIDATITISYAKIVGITADPIDVVYDGKSHRITFRGFDNDGSDGRYVYRGYSVRITPVGDELGNLYAINAGNYTGRVRISINNYETLEIATFIKIDKAKIEVESTSSNLPDQLPSGMSVKNDQYYGTYTTTDGVEHNNVSFIFKNQEGNIVTPNADGVLPDGEYTVVLDVGSNYYIGVEWKLVVGNINSKTLTVPAIVAVVAVAAIMVAAIITSVVVVNKRKKNEVIG